jgi:tetratricopeptide (TPR) repeat protein
VGPWRRDDARVQSVVPSAPKLQSVAVCLLLTLATLAVYLQTGGHEFIAYDDDLYVYQHPIVRKGLTAAGVSWAFTTFFGGNWFPLTWLSHMLDCELFGLDAGKHHLVNVALHLTSTLVLFSALVRMTRQPGRSALVAGVFAVHPLHVESVAWIAERKDALSTLFAVVAILLYVRYAEAPTRWRLALVVVAFGLGLMAKPMLVTLPLVLVLLDFWPLRRLRWPLTRAAVRGQCREKLPLVALAAISCALTFHAQQAFGAVVPLSRLPLDARLANAVASYGAYLAKAVWPSDLAVLYPRQRSSVEAVLAGSVLLAAVSALALRLARRRPYLLVGWLWYLGMLFPVIGLVQVGVQGMADRYAYLPLVGFSLAFVWAAADLVERAPGLRALAATLAVGALAALAATSHGQVGHWQSSRTLFEHTLSVTSGNYVIHNNLGNALAADGLTTAAISHYEKALSIAPFYAEAHFNLARMLSKQGLLEEATSHLAAAIRIKPRLPVFLLDMGALLVRQGDYENARLHLETLVGLSPGHALAESRLCFVLERLGRLDEAIAHCVQAVSANPGLLEARFHLGTALAARGRASEAALEFSRVLVADPTHAGARAALGELQR